MGMVIRSIKYIIYLLIIALPLFAQDGIPTAPDTPEQTLSFFFKGAWQPDLDPAEIGPENYKTLENLRYGSGEVGLEAVQGYTRINTTTDGIGSYLKIRSGHQLETDRSTASYVLVQAEDSGETTSRVFVNDTTIPSQGNFSTTINLNTSGNAYFEDSTGAGLGRFSDAPNGNVAYCNDVECLVWAGEEMRVGSFFSLENSSPYNAAAYPIDHTEAINNRLFDAANRVTIGTGSRDYFLIMTSRPIQGVYFDVNSANTTAAVLDIHYRKTDATWAAIAETDGTLTGGDTTLGQDGWVTWTHVTDAAPYHYQGVYLYTYRFYVNAAEATIQYITVDAPMQNIVDLWDGVDRQPIQFKVWRNGDGVFKDYTLEVNEQSYEELPYVAQLDAMTSSDYLIVMSEERLSGIKFAIMEGFGNTTAGTDADVQYWDGDSYADVAEEFDGTELSTACLGQSGLLWWQPPSETSEIKKTEFGVTGYSYKIIPDGTLSGLYRGKLTVSGAADNGAGLIRITTGVHNLGSNDVVTITGVVGTTEANGTWAITSASSTTFDLEGSTFNTAYTSGGQVIRSTDDIASEQGDIAIDVVTVIPAQLTVRPFRFPSTYKNRLLLCGYIKGKEANRCDYSSVNTTEAWNGADSSDGGSQSLYFGGSEPLTSGHQIYNRYGSRVITMWAAFKDGETYVLQGDSPEDFKIEQVSVNIGNPAPLTLASAEVAYESAPDVRRNMLFWLSYAGPYSFDGQILAPIKGVHKYFDPDNEDCINFDEIEKSVGWYDGTNKEYNLLIPSGSSQTTNNVWLVYDLLKKKWFTKDTGAAEFPQVAFPVKDTYGNQYIYGGIDVSTVVRLENGPLWKDGTPSAGVSIEQVVETGDFFPTNNIWELTRIRKVKVMSKRVPDQHQVIIQHFSNTEESYGSAVMDEASSWNDAGSNWANKAYASLNIYEDNSLSRITTDTARASFDGWSHRFRFTVVTDETTKGFQPLGWGVVVQEEGRYDE
jgi:hypothetical protein